MYDFDGSVRQDDLIGWSFPLLSINSPFTYCLDIHAHGNSPHMAAIADRCPRPDDEEPRGMDYDGGTYGVKKGDRWGLKLKNAKVSIRVGTGSLH